MTTPSESLFGDLIELGGLLLILLMFVCLLAFLSLPLWIWFV